MPVDIPAIVAQFAIEGAFNHAVPITTGHINDTYLSEFQTPAGRRRYVHQRINTYVFHEPVKVMENIIRVLHYSRQQHLAAGQNPDRRVLQLVPDQRGEWYYFSPSDGYWRTYVHIEQARTYDQPENPGQLYQAARAFGKFQSTVSGLPGPRLHETIPGFHDTPRRLGDFLEAVHADAAGRLIQVKSEVSFLLDRHHLAERIIGLLRQGLIPERITHNDTKLNNVMIDDLTGEGLCVIDLDTVMPGSALYDFGDMVRSGATTAAEDEPDLHRVHFDLLAFEQLVQGYLDATADFLTPLERQNLVYAARVITYEQALRFLTDYLNGDVYYKIHRSEHNLDRARTQIRLVTEMEAQQENMEALISLPRFKLR